MIILAGPIIEKPRVGGSIPSLGTINTNKKQALTDYTVCACFLLTQLLTQYHPTFCTTSRIFSQKKHFTLTFVRASYLGIGLYRI